MLSSSQGSLAAGPNTSTPADELEGNSSQRSGQSRHSSPALQDDTADNRLGLEAACREDEVARKRLSGHFNITDLIPGEELELQAGAGAGAGREVVVGREEAGVVEKKVFDGVKGVGERDATVSSHGDEETKETKVGGQHQESSMEPMETGPQEHLGEDWQANFAIPLDQSTNMGMQAGDEKVSKISEPMFYESDNIWENGNMYAAEAKPRGLVTPHSKTPEDFEFVQHLETDVEEDHTFEDLTPTPAQEALEASPLTYPPSSMDASLSKVLETYTCRMYLYPDTDNE